MKVRVDIELFQGDCHTRAICRRCDEEVEVQGGGAAAVQQCLAKLRGDCPMGERNHYYPKEVQG